MLRASLVVACLTAVTFVLPSQAEAQTRDDLGLWFAVFANGELDLPGGGAPKWTGSACTEDGCTAGATAKEKSPYLWWFDGHYRLFDDEGGFGQSIVRPGIGRKISENQAIWIGYGWIHTAPQTGEGIDENRLWQQWTATPKLGDYRFLHRSRFEQRWVETGDDVGLRWRQLARVQKILSDTPQWSVVLWDEAFFNLNDTDWGAEAGFDQNRAFLGVGFKFDPDSPVRTEIGYLNQFINRQGGNDRMNHILSINFFVDF